MSRVYAGIDLHSTNHVIVVTDAQDCVLSCKRLDNVLSSSLDVLAPYKESLGAVAVESTYNWYWLVDGLMEQGYDVRLVNTVAVQQYSGLKYADDKSDARWLAKMLHLGILPEGYIYPRDTRPVRDLLRRRMFMVKERTAFVLSTQNIITRNTGRRISGDGVKRLSDSAVQAMLPEPDVVLAVQSNTHLIRCLTEQIKRLEKHIKQRVKLREEYTILKTIPGVGDILALTIMLETGDIQRFARPADYASYTRCVTSTHTSNGKKKGQGNRKNGNKYLAWAFIEAANYAIRFNDTIERYYQRKLSKNTHNVIARKTIAHKLVRASWHMLRNQQPFNIEKAFR